MRAFLQELTRDPWLAVPVDLAQQRWPVALEQLVAVGAVRREAAQEGDRWPCGVRSGCARVLLADSEGWVAVCEDDPPGCEETPAAGERVRVDPCGWLRFLARACGLPDGPVVDGSLATLGSVDAGRDRVVFAWCARPARLAHAELEALADRHRPDALVVLLPTSMALPPSFPARAGRARVLPIALDRAMDPVLQRVDLADLVLRAGIGGPEWLDVRFELVLAGERVRWSGRELDVARNPQQRALIGALRAGRGAWCSRSELLPALFPDEFTNRGRALTDVVKLERRLRQLVTRANEAAGLHPDGRSLIENLRGRTDLDGGYRLSVPPDRTIDLEESRDDRP